MVCQSLVNDTLIVSNVFASIGSSDIGLHDLGLFSTFPGFGIEITIALFPD